MTARHQIRVGGRRLGRDRGAPIDATPAPPVGEVLRVAREKKGVDIYRAERDTKIRAKHLDALENGAYNELPGAVYIKGFLRNYATYLGLDPDEIIEQWRDETSSTRRTEAVAVAPPRPIAEPRRGLTFTPGIIVAALVSLIVIAFFAYLGSQVLRFNQATPNAVSGALVVDLPPDAESHVIEGTTLPAATVTITGPGEFMATTEADDEGAWSLEVPLTKGRNDFTVIARDPTTDRDSPPVSVIVTVPVPATDPPPSQVAGASPSPTSALPPATLTLTSPAEGASLSGSTVTVAGTTDGTSVVVSASFAGEPGASATSSPVGSPSASAEPAPTPAAPAPSEVTITDGAFTTDLALPVGRWTISITASAEGRADAVQTRTVDLAFDGVTVVVEVRGGDAWLIAWEDGRRVRTTSRVFRNGETLPLSGERTVTVNTGNAGATRFTVNGRSLGTLGPRGAVQTWVFEKGKAPRQA